MKLLNLKRHWKLWIPRRSLPSVLAGAGMTKIQDSARLFGFAAAKPGPLALRGYSRGNPSFSVVPGLLRVLAMTAILFVLIPKAQASVIKPPNNLGLVGYWSMEDGQGSTLTDFSGKGSVGALTGASGLPTWTTGRVGMALNFDGTDDMVNIGTPAPLTNLGPYTLSVWIRPDTVATNPYVLSKRGASGAGAWRIDVNSSGGVTWFKEFSGNDITLISNTSRVFAGQWAQVAVVWDGTSNASNGYIYINGVDETASRINGTGTADSDAALPINIGSRNGTSAFFDGLIDEARIYNRALSATEIVALYGQTGIGKIKNAARGLVGHWMFDEMTGTTVADKTSNGSIGTMLPVPTSISRVQFRHTYPGTSGAALAFSSSVTTGNLIIVAASGSGGTVSTVSDNCSNTYAQAASGSVSITASEVWYAYNVTGGTCTITVTSSMVDFGMTIFEYTGASTGNPLGETHVDLQKKSGTAFTTTVDGMIFLSWANEQSGADTSGAGVGWTEIQHDTGHYDLQAENLSATAGSYTPVVSGSDQTSDVLIAVAFRGKNRPTWQPGKYNGGMRFDGVDDYVQMGDLQQLRIENNPFTLAAWVNVASQPADGTSAVIVAKGVGGSGGYGLQYVGAGGGVYQISLTKYGVIDQGVVHTLSLDTWHHVAAVQTASQVEYFVNGASVGTFSNSSAYASSASFDFNIGSMSSGPASPWNGRIDDVRVYSRTLSATEIANIYNSSGEGVAIVNASMNNLLINGLVALHSFNGADMTAATSTDRSGYGNDGALVNGPRKVIGINGQALKFDGVDDYVDTKTDTLFDFSAGNFTISAWFKTSNATGGKRIVSKGSTTVNYEINVGGGGIVVAYVNDGVSACCDAVTSALSYSDGQWHHLAYVVGATNMTLFIDGVSVGTNTHDGSLLTNNVNFAIGKDPNNVGGYFDGLIDDVRIYNRALSPSDILQLYSIGQ